MGIGFSALNSTSQGVGRAQATGMQSAYGIAPLAVRNETAASIERGLELDAIATWLREGSLPFGPRVEDQNEATAPHRPRRHASGDRAGPSRSGMNDVKRAARTDVRNSMIKPFGSSNLVTNRLYLELPNGFELTLPESVRPGPEAPKPVRVRELGFLSRGKGGETNTLSGKKGDVIVVRVPVTGLMPRGRYCISATTQQGKVDLAFWVYGTETVANLRTQHSTEFPGKRLAPNHVEVTLTSNQYDCGSRFKCCPLERYGVMVAKTDYKGLKFKVADARPV
jgi:hypothetical protein